MDDVREIIRRLQIGQSIKEIHRELGSHRKTVRRYRRLAEREDWLQGPLPELAAIEAALAKRVSRRVPDISKAEPHRAAIQELLLRGVEAKAIHQKLVRDSGFTGSYNSVQRFVKRLKAVTPTAVMRIEVEPGEECQVDFGSGPRLVDELTGEAKKTWFFVMTLSHSRHQYVEMVLNQTVETWIACHIHAFMFFGGVPKKAVIDNLKAAIVKACFDNPQVQRAYREFAIHYGFLISPCRPYTPQHKGKVENGVHYIKRNALAGQDFKDLASWNAYLKHWCLEVAGKRVHGTTFEKPMECFTSVEKITLQKLPETRYEIVSYHTPILHPDCYTVFEKSYYSAPHRFIGKTMLLKAAPGRIELYFEHERVATHPRATKKGQRKKCDEHWPPEKLRGILPAPTWLKAQAAEIGIATLEVVERLLAHRPEDRMRWAMAIVAMTKKHGNLRVESSCRRALACDAVNYPSIKEILRRKLYLEPLPLELFTPGPVPKSAAFARPLSNLAAHFERKRSWN